MLPSAVSFLAEHCPGTIQPGEDVLERWRLIGAGRLHGEELPLRLVYQLAVGGLEVVNQILHLLLIAAAWG